MKLKFGILFIHLAFNRLSFESFISSLKNVWVYRGNNNQRNDNDKKNHLINLITTIYIYM